MRHLSTRLLLLGGSARGVPGERLYSQSVGDRVFKGLRQTAHLARQVNATSSRGFDYLHVLECFGGPLPRGHCLSSLTSTSLAHVFAECYPNSRLDGGAPEKSKCDITEEPNSGPDRVELWRRTTTKGRGVSPKKRPPDLQALRLKYRIAYDAYRTCFDALSKASVRGEGPSMELLKREAEALREFSESRANLLAAMRSLD